MVVAADSANKVGESVDLSVSKALREDNVYLHAGIGGKGRGCFKVQGVNLAAAANQLLSGLVTHASMIKSRDIFSLATLR